MTLLSYLSVPGEVGFVRLPLEEVFAGGRRGLRFAAREPAIDAAALAAEQQQLIEMAQMPESPSRRFQGRVGPGQWGLQADLLE